MKERYNEWAGRAMNAPALTIPCVRGDDVAKRSVADRFWAKVDKDGPGGCWLWTAAKNPKGYGRFYLDGRNQLAHRVAYLLVVGPIPPGLQLDHVVARGCLHRHCVNPHHLEPVTNRENLLRSPLSVVFRPRILKTHCIHGHSLADAYVGAKGFRTCRHCVKGWNAARNRRRKSNH